MRLPDRVFDLYRRLFGRWTLDDPRPLASAAPYTFQMPSSEEIQALGPGDEVKLIFRSIPTGRVWDAERMWVEITGRQGNAFEGVLDNHPSDIPQIKAGSEVRFNAWHVIATQFMDPELESRLAQPSRDWVYGRCLVDESVIESGAPVGYIYREESDMGEPDDKYPDTGWRLRAKWRPEESEEEYDARRVVYRAIGLVLNRDASIEPLLSEPVGSRFCRENGLWVRMESEPGK